MLVLLLSTGEKNKPLLILRGDSTYDLPVVICVRARLAKPFRNVRLALSLTGVSACQNIPVYSYCVSQINQSRLLYFVLVWQFFSKSNPQHDLRNSVVKKRCRIRKFSQLLLFYHPHVIPTPEEKALDDGKRSEYILILVRELSSVARVHHTISPFC